MDVLLWDSYFWAEWMTQSPSRIPHPIHGDLRSIKVNKDHAKRAEQTSLFSINKLHDWPNTLHPSQ